MITKSRPSAGSSMMYLPVATHLRHQGSGRTLRFLSMRALRKGLAKHAFDEMRSTGKKAIVPTPAMIISPVRRIPCRWSMRQLAEATLATVMSAK
jgi:hypothetical protein